MKISRPALAVTLSVALIGAFVLPSLGQDERAEPPTDAETPPEIPPAATDPFVYPADPEAVESDQPEPAVRPVERVRARLVEAPGAAAPGHRWVRSIRRWRADAGRPDWSRQGDWIVYDRVGDRGFRALYLGKADAPLERCLTCDLYELRDRNILHATWHPSGEVVVAVVQQVPKRLELDLAELATVEGLLRAELWAIHRDGRDAWQITRAREMGGSTGPAAFSYEGGRMAWSERVDSTAGGRWGDWTLRVADFRLRRGLPRVATPDTYDAMPWPGTLQVSEFTTDDRGVFVGASAPASRGGEGRVVARYSLDGDRFQVLAEGGTWDDDPAQVPRGERLVWASGRGLDPPRRLPRRQDLWIMSASGRAQERLTFFNDPASPDDLGEAMIGGVTWAPDGERLLVHVVWSPDDAAARDADDPLAEPLESLESLEPAPFSEAVYLIRLDPAVHGSSTDGSRGG